MVADNIEEQIYDFVRPYAGTYLFTKKNIPLTPETDLDSDLSIDELEAEDLMAEFFKTFMVEKGTFNIKTYFPHEKMSLNPFKKNVATAVPDFTIGMLIASAKSGRWLYD